MRGSPSSVSRTPISPTVTPWNLPKAQSSVVTLDGFHLCAVLSLVRVRAEAQGASAQ